MALIPVNFDEVVELKPIVNGRYNLTVASCEKVFSKSESGSKPQLKLSVGIDGHDEAPNITHFIGIPSEKDTEKDKLDFKALLLKRNCMLFGVPLTNDDEQLAMSFVGARASNVEVTQSEPTPTGEVYNRIMVPKLKGEGQPKAGGGAAKPPKS